MPPPQRSEPLEISTTPTTARKQTVVLILLGIGVMGGAAADALVAPAGAPGKAITRLIPKWGPVLMALVLSFVPTIRGFVGRAIGQADRVTPRGRVWTMLLVTIIAYLYLFASARMQGRDLMAKEQDESMYLIQTQMLARGKLWMPAHPLADWFESFHVIVRPVYAGMYFPGTALAYAPSVWLGAPPWMFSFLFAALSVGMMYRVLAELVDESSGLMGAFLLIGAIQFRRLSTMVMSHMLMLLMGLVLTWAFLRWRETKSLKWAAVCGMVAGWAAITRPVDALCYAAPVTVAVAWSLWRERQPVGRWMLTAVVACLSALPFLSLQLMLNKGVTGRISQTPVTMYHQHYWPHVQIGFKGDVEHYKPPTQLAEFQEYYSRYIVPSYHQFRNNPPVKLLAVVRAPLLLQTAFPTLMLAALIPLGVFNLRGRGRIGLLAAAPLFLLAYATFMFYRKHYGVAFFPPLFLGAMLGARTVSETLGGKSDWWRVFLVLAVLGVVVAGLPQINRRVSDQTEPTPVLHAVNVAIEEKIRKPAILMVRHANGTTQEPVYNTGVAWPDDAVVVRVHDLGERNGELFAYYAKHQPQREVYLFDKRDLSTRYLGKVVELAGGARQKGDGTGQ